METVFVNLHLIQVTDNTTQSLQYMECILQVGTSVFERAQQMSQRTPSEPHSTKGKSDQQYLQQGFHMIP